MFYKKRGKHLPKRVEARMWGKNRKITKIHKGGGEGKRGETRTDRGEKQGENVEWIHQSSSLCPF